MDPLVPHSHTQGDTKDTFVLKVKGSRGTNKDLTSYKFPLSFSDYGDGARWVDGGLYTGLRIEK